MNGRPGMRTGCLPRRANIKAPFLFSDILRADAPVPPARLWREYKIPGDAWNMFGNDKICDCLCAMIAHTLMLITAHTGKIVIPTLADVVKVYSAVSGYDPVTGANDNGCAMSDVLNYWMHTGIAGHQILAWGDIDITNVVHQKYGMYALGATADAVFLPNSAMDQFNADEPFTVLANDGGADGGHGIPRFGYGVLGATCVTWQREQAGTWDWWLKYLMESAIVVTEDWVNNATGLAPNLFNMDKLNAVLNSLRAA